MKLAIRVEHNGDYRLVGTLETHSGIGGVFSYADEWLEGGSPYPLSLSLPLRKEPYCEKELRPYFEGLLPEEYARIRTARELGISETSYLKMLAALGDECIGAVRISDEADGPGVVEPGYTKVSDSEMEELARLDYALTSRFSVETRLSLAGAQSKTGLYRDPDDFTWWMPAGTAPSNCIVKLASDRFPGLVENELFCLALAHRCGIPAAHAYRAPTSSPMLVVDRYDRFCAGENRLGGHRLFARLHQEDFCQALGMLPAQKYEGRKQGYLARVAEMLRTHSSKALEDIALLYDLQLFNCFIGNCDAHAKNFSMMRSVDWREISLAPAYDVVSTAVYPELSRVLGMSIGGIGKLDDVGMEAFEGLARDFGMSARVARRHVEDMRERMSVALDDMDGMGTDIGNRIAKDARRRIALLGGGLR